VVLIVLDTVRADHLSLCGYARPTSPTLERLRDDGARFSCGAVAPGSWTLPVHASFFTGLDVASHGADFARIQVGDSSGCEDVLCEAGDAGDDVTRLFGSIGAHPLEPGPQTLAERFDALGYQTLLVSGNPVLSEVTGLTRGFERAISARRFAQLEGARLIRALKKALGGLDRSGPPLFLTVNITEAHQPYEAVPPGVGWLPPREEIRYFIPGADPWKRFVSGEMSGEARETFLAHVVDVYDWGVFRADRTLGQVLAALESDGWLTAGIRLVVTSDHGELLGEHGLLDHGGYLWEPIARVPLLIRDTTREPPSLPPLLSSRAVYRLVLDGTLPDSATDVTATAQPNYRWQLRTDGRVGGTQPSAALWLGHEKLQWIEGRALRYDLRTDPEEREPQAVSEHPQLERLAKLMTQARRVSRLEAGLDPELVERLKAAGYAD
jgi:hypothetical protein